MKVKLTVQKDFEVKYLQIDAHLTSIEGSEVNGRYESDNEEPKMPLVTKDEDGEYHWKPTIELATGKIQNWPLGTTASVRYNVCDDAEYALLDADEKEIVSREDYVPEFLEITEDGYGDCLNFDVDSYGVIKDWKVSEDDLHDFFDEYD